MSPEWALEKAYRGLLSLSEKRMEDWLGCDTYPRAAGFFMRKYCCSKLRLQLNIKRHLHR